MLPMALAVFALRANRRGDALYVNDGVYGALSDAGAPGFRFPHRLLRLDGAASEVARAGWKGSGERPAVSYERLIKANAGLHCEFQGYQHLSIDTRVVGVIRRSL